MRPLGRDHGQRSSSCIGYTGSQHVLKLSNNHSFATATEQHYIYILYYIEKVGGCAGLTASLFLRVC